MVQNSGLEEKTRRMDSYNTTLNTYTSLYRIVLNISDYCNRSCNFCPRGNTYRSRNKFMSVEVVKELVYQTMPFKGVYSLSGFGEPTLHPELSEIVKFLKLSGRVELTTNGDYLDRLKGLDIDQIDVSCYEKPTPERLAYWDTLGLNLNLKNLYESNNFNNRAGNSTFQTNKKGTLCSIPFYRINIDYNGDVILCCSDWNRDHIFGSIMKDSLYSIWINSLKDIRLSLLKGERVGLCSKCDCEGFLNGEKFVDYWSGYYDKQQKKGIKRGV